MHGNRIHNLIKAKYQIINNMSPPCETYVLKCKNRNIISLVDIFLKFKGASKIESTSKNENKSHNKYDTHVLVLESLSKKNIFKYFPKMINFLRTRNNIFIIDDYVSVSNTTTGNVYAMFLNKNVNNIKNFKQKTSFQKADLNLYDCKKSFSDIGFIGDIFQKNNYTTLLAENGYNSIFKNPYCQNQLQPNFNHTSFPYGKIMSFLTNHNDEYNSTYTGQCKASFFDLLTYSQDFYRYNNDNPKFSINWLTGFKDKSLDSYERADLALTEFFITNSDILDKSFFFLLTDKGEMINDDEEKSTKNIDDIKPFMLISIPKYFNKTNKIYQNLKDNSEGINISSFDIYATLYSIAEQIDSKKFDENDDTKNNFLKGKNIFQPIGKRSCFNLNIDHENCIDSYIFTPLKYVPEEILQTFQYIFIKVLNNKLKESKLDGYCHELTLKPNSPFKISYILNNNKDIFWKITGTVKPGNAIFTSIFDDELNLFIDDIKRHNPNENQSLPCISNNRYSIYCQCNKKLFFKYHKKKYNKKHNVFKKYF
uniref:GTP-binding protein n=2 Tax=Strongyloides stercoralis TaxID=6248 RepID=A0AAF5CYX6_STRER